MFVSCTAPTLSDRVALIVDGLCRVVAAHSARDRSAGPMIILVWSQLRRLVARFSRLAAQDPAGTRPAPSATPARQTARVRTRPAPPLRLSRSFAWLVRAMPETACCGTQLRHLLAGPEAVALLAADPRMARMLRPLCRMLGIETVPSIPVSSIPVPAPSRASPAKMAPPVPRPPRTPPERRQPGRLLRDSLVRALSGRVLKPA